MPEEEKPKNEGDPNGGGQSYIHPVTTPAPHGADKLAKRLRELLGLKPKQ